MIASMSDVSLLQPTTSIKDQYSSRHPRKGYQGKIYVLGAQDPKLIKHHSCSVQQIAEPPLVSHLVPPIMRQPVFNLKQNQQRNNKNHNNNNNKVNYDDNCERVSTSCHTTVAASDSASACLPYYQSMYRPLILTNMLRTQGFFYWQDPDLLKPCMLHSLQRNSVLNWVVLIHTKYNFQPETLHEALSMFNRYLSRKSYLSPYEYEKVALTCLWMAAKMQQRKIKTLKAWLVFGKGYAIEQIIETEEDILLALDFELTVPTSYEFIQTLSTYYPVSQRCLALATYILQLSLLETHYRAFQQHIISLASLYLAFKILGVSEWNQRLESHLNTNIKDIRDCAQQLSKTLQKAHLRKQSSSVFRKYCSRQYHQIARIKLGRRSQSKAFYST